MMGVVVLQGEFSTVALVTWCHPTSSSIAPAVSQEASSRLILLECLCTSGHSRVFHLRIHALGGRSQSNCSYTDIVIH